MSKKKGDIAFKVPASAIETLKDRGMDNEKIAAEIGAVAIKNIKDLLDKRDAGVKVRKVKASSFKCRGRRYTYGSVKKQALRMSHACARKTQRMLDDMDRKQVPSNCPGFIPKLSISKKAKLRTANEAIGRYALEVARCSREQGKLLAKGKQKQSNFLALAKRKVKFFDKIQSHLKKIEAIYEGK